MTRPQGPPRFPLYEEDDDASPDEGGDERGARQKSNASLHSLFFARKENPAPSPAAATRAASKPEPPAQPPRKSRRVRRWLAEQSQHASDEDIEDDPTMHAPAAGAVGTPSNPYLAYPQLARLSLVEPDAAKVPPLHDYVVIEEDEVRDTVAPAGASLRRKNAPQMCQPTPSPVTMPYHATTARHSRPQSVPPAGPWKSFSLALSLPRRPSSAADNVEPLTPPQSPKKSGVFRRAPLPQVFRSAQEENKSPAKGRPAPQVALPNPETPVTVRLKQELALRQLGISPALGKAASASSPRPSTSASTASLLSVSLDETPERVQKVLRRSRRSRFSIRLAGAAGVGADRMRDEESQFVSPSKQSLVSAVTVASRSTFFSSSHTFSSPSQHSVTTTSMKGSGSGSGSGPGSPVAKLALGMLGKKKSQSIYREKGHNVSTSMLSTSSKGVGFGVGGRRKKLVVSGIARDNLAAVEGLRAWCEGFGELRQMTRVPNGDVHVDFKRADVADTVCRISARVFIAGVGSVGLSWYTGKRSW